MKYFNNSYSLSLIYIVRTGFDLNPKRERIQVHVTQTMNLQSAGKKASLILGQDIGFQCKKVKDTRVECRHHFFRTPPYIPCFLPFSSSTCGPGIQSPFSSSSWPSLESSILSWKAVRSLFKYHLHINAARRLAGRHLMRR